MEWIPEVRFYEAKIGVLKRYEDEDILDAFRVQEESVHARLTSEDHEVRVAADRLWLRAATPRADRELLLRAAQMALEEVRPDDPTMTIQQ